MATKSTTAKASAKSKRFVADPEKGLHPDTNRPRLEEIRVLTPQNSPSRIGFGGPKAAPPKANHAPTPDSPVDRPMGNAPTPRAARARKASAKKAAAPKKAKTVKK